MAIMQAEQQQMQGRGASAAKAKPTTTKKKEGWALFSLRTSLEAERKRFEAMTEAQPALAKSEIQRGAMLVGLAKEGRLERLEDVVRARAQWYWFTVQMYRAAALKGHVNVLEFMTQNGVPLDMTPLDEILPYVAQNADEDPAIRSTRYLASVCHISQARRIDYWTALHLACARGLHRLAEVLVDLGADVNAVAKDDIMPLHCANENKPILQLLRKHNARYVWRRQSSPVVPPQISQVSKPLPPPTTRAPVTLSVTSGPALSFVGKPPIDDEQDDETDETVDDDEHGGFVFGTPLQN